MGTFGYASAKKFLRPHRFRFSATSCFALLSILGVIVLCGPVASHLMCEQASFSRGQRKVHKGHGLLSLTFMTIPDHMTVFLYLHPLWHADPGILLQTNHRCNIPDELLGEDTHDAYTSIGCNGRHLSTIQTKTMCARSEPFILAMRSYHLSRRY